MSAVLMAAKQPLPSLVAVAALFEGAAARSVDLDSVFAGAGEVADGDDDPDHARAGWYADPSAEPATLRYWNGSDWTDHVHKIPGGNDLCDSGARQTQ